MFEKGRMLMPVAACYVRVSTENQKENYSIEEQKARLQAFCTAKDISVGKMYVDGGYSGGSLRRPALQQMLRRLCEYDLVVVYKLDRLSRSQKDTLTLIEDYFLAQKVDFISVSENFDTSTPLGRAMIGMLSVFAQLEKEQITERFTMGRIARAKKGYYHGGSSAPVGYDYINGQLVINEEKAGQVRELYTRFRQGFSVHACWQYMQSRYGAAGWSSETQIRHILSNEVYLGKVRFQGEVYPGLHTPLITETLFGEVQKLLRERRSPSSHPFSPRTLLSGLLFCGQCGARCYGGHGRYYCSGQGKRRAGSGGAPVCRNRKWSIARLDTLVTDTLCRMQFPADAFAGSDPEDILRYFFLHGCLEDKRLCLSILIRRIYVQEDTVTLLLEDIC